MERILFYRSVLDNHIRMVPEFMTSLLPLAAPEGAHPLVHEMYKASEMAGTGPMSAVAGAVAEYICRDLLSAFGFKEVVVENGGDIFMKIESPAIISVYAGTSPLSGKTGLAVKPGDTPLAICCSSGTVGHSLSFGTADACMIACRSGAGADAYATAFCNRIKTIDIIGKIIEEALQISDILAAVMIKDDNVGMGGRIETRVL